MNIDIKLNRTCVLCAYFWFNVTPLSICVCVSVGWVRRSVSWSIDRGAEFGSSASTITTNHQHRINHTQTYSLATTRIFIFSTRFYLVHIIKLAVIQTIFLTLSGVHSLYGACVCLCVRSLCSGFIFVIHYIINTLKYYNLIHTHTHTYSYSYYTYTPKMVAIFFLCVFVQLILLLYTAHWVF